MLYKFEKSSSTRDVQPSKAFLHMFDDKPPSDKVEIPERSALVRDVQPLNAQYNALPPMLVRFDRSMLASEVQP